MYFEKIKKFICIFLLFVTIFNLFAVDVFADTDNSNQIVVGSTSNPAGSDLNSDGVKVSKTLIPTNIENQFDVELEVTTTTKIEELYKESDAAVIIVMDISYTMREHFTGTTTPKYLAALSAAEEFVKDFGQYSDGSGALRKIGFAAFNTHGHEILDLTDCKSLDDATTIFDTVEKDITDIILSVDKANHDRFTNIEAGLKIGRSMLDDVDTDKKYLIFISDGLPTTYVSSGYQGYDPYDSKGARFKNRKTNKPCSYGTSYSDEAAHRAEVVAEEIKADTKIFSIGVDIGGLTVEDVLYSDTHDTSGNVVNKAFSIVDCYASGDYVIDTDEDGFKNWLKNNIGSGYYYNSDDQDEIEAAIKDIFNVMKEEDKVSVENSWVTADALNDSITPDNIKFMYFYDKDGNIVGNSLSGETGENLENTAGYSDDNDAISWDLKYSGYESSVSGNITRYTYKLKYRLRLMNELEPFSPGESYVTNGPTSLTYQVRTNAGLSAIKTIDFIIPSIKGYLGSISSVKMSDKTGLPLSDAVFTLIHKADDCSICQGTVEISDYTSITNSDGLFSFDTIPSGHEYFVKETVAPDGYLLDETMYEVLVSYGTVTSNLPSIIINYPVPVYTLPILINKEFVGFDDDTNDYVFEFSGVLSDEFGVSLNSNQVNSFINITGSGFGSNTIELMFTDEQLINNTTYFFKVEEVPGSVEDIFYDTNYYLIEVKIVHSAPELISVKKFNSKGTEISDFNYDGSLLFVNYVGLSEDVLPSTGGNGTIIFDSIGILFIIIGVFIFFKKVYKG